MRTEAVVTGLVAAGGAAVLLFVPNARQSDALAQAATSQQEVRPADQMPQFTEDGDLVHPTDWERWVMVGSSIGLSYSELSRERGPDEAPGMFHNIYMQPWA